MGHGMSPSDPRPQAEEQLFLAAQALPSAPERAAYLDNVSIRPLP